MHLLCRFIKSKAKTSYPLYYLQAHKYSMSLKKLYFYQHDIRTYIVRFYKSTKFTTFVTFDDFLF